MNIHETIRNSYLDVHHYGIGFWPIVMWWCIDGQFLPMFFPVWRPSAQEQSSFLGGLYTSLYLQHWHLFSSWMVDIGRLCRLQCRRRPQPNTGPFQCLFFGRSTSLSAPRWVLSGPTGGHGHDDVEPRHELPWLSMAVMAGLPMIQQLEPRTCLSTPARFIIKGLEDDRVRNFQLKLDVLEDCGWPFEIRNWVPFQAVTGGTSVNHWTRVKDLNHLQQNIVYIIIYNKYTDFSQRWRIRGMRPNISNISICIVWGTSQEQTASYADYTWLKCHRLLDRTKVGFGVELFSFWCWSHKIHP